MVFSYRTIKNASEGFYKEKGSKFIARAFPVSSIEQVNAILAELRKEYHDARHHCYAYILNSTGDQYRANDDGEPNHSAGDPILGQIKSSELTNTLIVVIRYFGGTKLGVSGLITAYKTAAAEALSNTTAIIVEVMEQISFNFPYESTNDIMKLIDKFSIKIIEQQYENSCQIIGRVPVRNLELLKSEVELQINLGSKIDLKA